MQETSHSIGTRKIRSAGRASGSIEITLPPELAALEGMQFRIVLRDGARPEIVLEPDLAAAFAVFTHAWSRLRAMLRLAGDIGEFPAQECELALLPGQRHDGRPLLVYSQAWQMSPSGQRLAQSSPPGTHPERRAAMMGLISPLATVAGHRLGLVSPMAEAFGAAVAGLAAQVVPRSFVRSDSMESSVAFRIWNEVYGPDGLPLEYPDSHSRDGRAQQALQRVISRFRGWQEHPDSHALARAQWSEELVSSVWKNLD